MTTPHDDIRELLAAFALGATSPGEDVTVEAHLAECAECALELRGLTDAAAELAYAQPLHAPPEVLRGLVLEGIRESGDSEALSQPPGNVRGAHEQAGAPWPPVRHGRTTRARGGFRRSLVPALAAACLVLGVSTAGLGMYVNEMRSDLDARSDSAPQQPRSERITAVPIETSGTLEVATGSLVITADSAVVVLHNVPAPAPGKSWQLWSIDADDEPHSVAVLEPQSGSTAIPLSVERASEARAVAITLEPRGGSEEPTSTPQAFARV